MPTMTSTKVFTVPYNGPLVTGSECLAQLNRARHSHVTNSEVQVQARRRPRAWAKGYLRAGNLRGPRS